LNHCQIVTKDEEVVIILAGQLQYDYQQGFRVIRRTQTIGDLDLIVFYMKREYPVWTVTEPDSWSHIHNIECSATGQYSVLLVIVIS
jgi:hypothetical protein